MLRFKENIRFNPAQLKNTQHYPHILSPGSRHHDRGPRVPRPRGGHGGRAGGRGADQGGRGRDQAEAGRQDGEGVARGQALPGPQNLSGGDLQHPDLPPDLRVQDESHKESGSDSDVCTDKDCKLAWLRGRHFSISADLAVASWCCLLARMVTEVGFIMMTSFELKLLPIHCLLRQTCG